MDEQNKKAPIYVEIIAWFILHLPYYAAFYLLIELIKCYT
jgi:hypothetical protein